MRTAGTGLPWLIATVVELRQETPTAKTIAFDVPEWRGHLAGQHIDVRLTAEDGYVAQRSFSLASPAGEDKIIETTVQRVDQGEVSPFLVDELRIGDQLELRGPIGGYFAWSPLGPRPLMLIGGGSGVVPLMSMLRTRRNAGDDRPTLLLYSSRWVEQILYLAELERIAATAGAPTIIYTLTRRAPPGWTGEQGRIDEAMLRRRGIAASFKPEIFVCGPTSFVEAVADQLLRLGHSEAGIRTERFGPTGETA